MTENKHGPARVADEDLVGYENKPGSAKVVEEPTGYDHPPTDRIPVPGDLSADRTDRTDTERDRTGADRLDDQVDDPRPTPVEAADIAEPAEPARPFEPVDEQVVEPVTGPTESPADAGLFEESEANRFRDRWRELQAGFVDDPTQAVRGADELVDEIMRELAERRQHLEGQWRDGPGDTEELRVVIREYRAFFNQLLNS
jgi:hypothetical protein